MENFFYLESFSLSVECNVDNEVSFDELSGYVRLLRVMKVWSEIENKTGFLSCPNEHRDVNTGSEGSRIEDVDEGDTVRRVFVAERRRRVIYKKRSRRWLITNAKPQTSKGQNEREFDQSSSPFSVLHFKTFWLRINFPRLKSFKGAKEKC